MSSYVFDDALSNSTVTCSYPFLGATIEPKEAQSSESLFFPGCSFINYAIPLVQSVYELLLGAGRVDGLSLVCCGKILRYESDDLALHAAFTKSLREHIASHKVKRLVVACPNCVKELRALLALDPLIEKVEVVPLPLELADMGYRIDIEVARKMVAAEVPDFEAAQKRLPYFAPHDSCPDRDTGEFADGLRALLPIETIREAKHNRRRSFCCGSLLRAAGYPDKAAQQSRRHGEEAEEAQADAIATACMSCTFLLSREQSAVPVFHYLELLYNWRINWQLVPPYMTLRFLFDDPASPAEGASRRSFMGIEAVAGDAQEKTENAQEAAASTQEAANKTSTDLDNALKTESQ